MLRPPRSLRMLAAAIVTVATLGTGLGPATATETAPAPIGPHDLFVSEINGDNTGTDFYEFFEVHNRTDEPVDLDALGIEFFYTSSDAPGQSGGTRLVRGGEGTTLPLPAVSAVIPAHGTTLFWVQNSRYLDKTDADFRAFYGLPADVGLIHVSGQDGFNNGGGRAIRVVGSDGTEISRSWVPSRPFTANGAVHYRVPAHDATSTSAPIWHDGSVEAGYGTTPGLLDPEQLKPASEPTPTQPTEPAPTQPTVPAPTQPTVPAPTQPTEPAPTEPTPTSEPATPADGDLTGEDLFISEIHPDNGTPGNVADTYEFFEVTNTTDEAIDLAARHVGVSYSTSAAPTDALLASALKFAVSDGVPGNAVVPAPLEATVPAHGSTIFWLDYSSTDVDTYAKTEADFRAFFGNVPADVAVVRVEGQGGIANGGARSLGLVDAGTAGQMHALSWSYLAARTPTTPGVSSHFRVGDGVARTTAFADSAATPGTVDAEQLVPSTDPTDPTPTDPTPTDPTPTDPAPTDPTPTTTPAPSVPEQPAAPPVDPELDAPILQVTEVAPDTANVGGSDAYEFVEVYNASQSPVRWRDFTISYLYLDGSRVVTSSALWPSVPDDVVIDPGKTLVLWVKNAANQALTAADFNAHWGSRLTAGVDLVEMFNGGMANGGLRALQIRTNTGHEISRADYMTDAETVADKPIQYAWESGTVQKQLGVDTGTPGYTGPSQVPAGLVADPASDDAPVITDLRGGPEVPVTEDLELAFDVTDDHQVRTVTLTLDTNVDGPTTRQLTFDAPGRYSYAIPDADLYGKRWVEYTVVARDGAHSTTLGPVRIDLQPTEPAPVRLNVRDGQYVAGQTRLAVSASNDPSGLELAIDGAAVHDTVPTLEKAPIFAFEATNTDAFFRNGVKLGDDVLGIFDEGFYGSVVTVPNEVPVDKIVKGEPFTVSVWAGTKAFPALSTDDNNDDFSIKNLRLALPDGRVLRPALVGVHATNGQTAYDPPVRTALSVDPGTSLAMGDGSSTYDYVEATFTVPDDAFDSRAHVWDTTAVADGEHQVTATVGDRTVTRTVVVDNTEPTVTSPVEDGRTYRGPFTVAATAADAGSGVETLTATLDGEAVTLPYATSSVDLAPGSHVATFTATDKLGNEVTRTVTFRTGDESSAVDLGGPQDGSEVRRGDVTLSATPTSAEGDDLTVQFRRGSTYDPEDAAVESFTGTTDDALAVDRDDRTLLTDDDLAAMAGTDGVAQEISSDTALPYTLFTVDVPGDAGADATVRLAWEGSANNGAKVLMYVLDTAKNAWQEVDRHVTDAEGEPAGFTLAATVPVTDHVRDGQVTVLIQHSEGFAGADRSERDSAVTPYNQAATPRQDYDFTLGWQSDTQYYNENQGYVAQDGNPDTFYRHQRNINQFFLQQRDNLNLQYVMHTGDVVDDSVATAFAGDNSDPEYEWKNASPSYRALDEAGLPYGVLAGNHDVGHAANDYAMFAKYFGKDRYASNPWYGGQIKNNRGHYDLISAGGIDFLVLSMGWGPGDEEIAWMNAVIKRYPERKVWINLHEYLLTTGTLGPIPQRIFDEVVKPNPNVFAVSSGHYHDAYTRTDAIDDDGDGAADRTVYSMLFDYQGLPEGGLGYLRLLHFDNAGQKIVVRTYSPSLDDFDSDDASLNDPAGQQEFEIPYAAVGLEPRTKSLATDSFRADVLGTRDIATLHEVASGSTVEAVWEDVEAGEHGWYVRTTGPYGGVHDSAVHTFTAAADGELTTATPAIAGQARVGSTLVAQPGPWGPSGVELGYQWFAAGTPIPGATQSKLVVGAALAGKRISVRVTGTLEGYTSTSLDSAPTAPVAAGLLTTGTPRITGTPSLGKTLTVQAGTWGPAGVRLSYQWLANGKPIAGRTGTRLVLDAKLVGKRISVRVTGTLNGYAGATRSSASTAAVAPGQLVGRTPRIAGKAKVGARLRAANVRWSPAPVTVRYQWYAGGKAIKGAKGSTLRVTKALAGKRLRLRVTVSKPGYRTVTRATASTAPVRRR